MPRPEKVQEVENIRARIESAEAAFLAEYRGLSVSEQQELRRRLHDARSEYSVVKMSLARLAVEKLGLEDLQEWLMGPTAIAFAQDDPVLTAKALRDFSQDHSLVLKAGVLGGQIIEPEQVEALAKIESREALLANLVGTGRASFAKLAGLLSAFWRDAAWMFRQRLDQAEAEEPEPAPAEPQAEEIPEDPEAAAEEDSPEEDSTTDDAAAAAAERTEAAEPEAAEDPESPVAADEATTVDSPTEGDEEEPAPEPADEADNDKE